MYRLCVSARHRLRGGRANAIAAHGHEKTGSLTGTFLGAFHPGELGQARAGSHTGSSGTTHSPGASLSSAEVSMPSATIEATDATVTRPE